MDRDRETARAVALALAALEMVVNRLGGEPLKPTLEMRAILAFLYRHGNGERRPFTDFWNNLVDPYSGQTETARAYIRATYGRTNMHRVWRASLADSEPYRKAVSSITRQHLIATDPDYAQRQLAVEAVKLASAVKVLEATKGVPRSVGSVKLAAHMRANGGSAAGVQCE